jgi:integrase
MASITRESNGRRIVQFVGTDGKRRSIRLGKVSQRIAEAVKLRVELIVAAKLACHAIDDETARWLSTLDKTMLGKLVSVGLIPTRHIEPAATLGPFLDNYVTKRIDVKPATKEIWSQVIRNLKVYLGESRELATVTEADAEDFKLYLIGEELASTTVQKRLQFASMFFKAARKRKLIPSNPFEDVTAVAMLSKNRQRYITVEEIERIINICGPDWKTIVALCRFGGLRCPSEVLSLRWQDIDWERNRIEVQSPKTEHHPGKASRTMPLFAELRPYLEDARAVAPKGAIYVVGGPYRESANTAKGWRNINLRTQFERLLKRAGFKPWPRLFHAMRASRETELAKKYPIHVVTAWLGNTPKIALKHYLQVTDEDFELAAGGGAESGAEAVQNTVQQPAAPNRNDSQNSSQALNTTGVFANSCELMLDHAGTSSGGHGIRTRNRLPGI